MASLDQSNSVDTEALVRAGRLIRAGRVDSAAQVHPGCHALPAARARLVPAGRVVAAAGVAVSLLAGVAWATSSGVHPARDVRTVAAVAPAAGSQAALPASSGVAGRTVAAGAPTATNPGAVAPLTRLHTADLLVTLPQAIDPTVQRTIRHLPMVDGVEPADAGSATVDGHRVLMLGVDPSSFRSYTPALTARSDELWRSVARGELTASFTMGHETRLPLGGTVPVRAHATRAMRVGAFASVGIAGVDAVVSRAQAAAIGLAPDRALVVSAPKGDALALRDAISALLPRGSHVELLRAVVVVRDAGEYLTRAQIRAVLQAAASRIGRPYVWGATGPDAFDCSGLVGWAFRQVGISLPRTSFQQWYAGPHVPLSDARPGDLLFWNYDPTAPDLPDHVALYAGNGMMIVAPHTGEVVRYTAVPTAHLMGVVRVDPATAARVDGSRF